MTLPKGVEDALGWAAVDEEGVLWRRLVPVGDPSEQGDTSRQPGPEDLEELLSPASTAKLWHQKFARGPHHGLSLPTIRYSLLVSLEGRKDVPLAPIFGAE
jgi:hypothetical protein